MPPTKTPPTEPGLYRWHDGRGKVIEYAVYYPTNRVGNLFAFNPAEAEHSKYVDKIIGGYWERIDLGEPYIAPEPPVVELWEGYLGSTRRILTRVDDYVLAPGLDGMMAVSCRWSERETYYTNLRKVGNLVLEREA